MHTSSRPPVLPIEPPYASLTSAPFTRSSPPPSPVAPDAVETLESGARPASRAAQFLRGRPDDPAWVRPALLALLASTLVLYTWGLSESGWANSFYSAAAQAGSESWKAFFFGSSDASNAITVDKPPLALWPMALSVRIFGLSSWSILLPQALMGVATVGVLYAAVRRVSTVGAGLLAGAILALTPVAALMFRFNNPDAALVLLMTLGAYAVVRAIETGHMKWIVATGAFVGLGFLAKQLQVLLVVPGFGLAYLIAAPGTIGRRIRDLCIAGGAMVASAGWWIAIVELTPAQYRPYIGGSQDNSILELTLGYNGLGRITGNETGSVGGGGGAQGGGMWGETGITRLFDGAIGGQAMWLVPAALWLLVAGLWVTRRAPRTDVTRASLVVWGGWLVVTGLTFSYMSGIFHEYYTVALAPGIAALVAIGATLLWRMRDHWAARGTLAVVSILTAWWSSTLLDRSPSWNPWLGELVVVGAVVGAIGLVLGRSVGTKVLAGAAALSVLAAIAGPAAYSLQTASEPHSGSIVTAGPAVTSGGFAGRGGFPGVGGQGVGGQGGPQGGANARPGGPNALPGGGTGFPGGGRLGGAPTGGGGGMGGLLNGTEPGDALVAALEEDADDYRWVAAAVGSNNASGYQLATEEPVMAIGGFNGSDPSPTLEQFRQYVADGAIHYFIGGGGFGAQNGGSAAGSEIAAWVEANFTAQTIDGVTVYDLTA
jgi:4-amino-4-deoxy-L-arabinose transferase-like glycosyltransferase